MARVFNICFQHKGKSYTALVSVSGKEDPSIQVISNKDSIQILLPTGSLVFSIAEVIQRLYASKDRGAENTTLFITPHISMQLMNVEW